MFGALAFLHLYFSTLTAQLGDSLYMAEHANAFTAACTREQTADQAEKCRRWTYFINGSYGYGQQSESDSHLANGMLGFTGHINDKLSLGIAATHAQTTDALGGGSEMETKANGGTLFMAYATPEGFRLYAAGMMQLLEIDTTRLYAGDRSTGSTTATAYGAATRMGWAVAASERNTVMPYIEYRWSSAQVDAFSETTGGGPASFGDNDLSTSQLRFGLSDNHKLNDNLVLTGTVAFGARLDNGRNRFADTSGSMAADQGFDAGDRGWGEATLAADWRVTGGLVLQGRIGAHTNQTADPTVTGNLGAALSF